MGIQVKGLNQVIANFSHYADNVLKEIVDGCEAVQAQVVNDAQLIVPVDTGHLQMSIKEGGIIVEDHNVRAMVIANADYASYVEWGTRRMVPQSFMGPALLENMATFRNAMAAATQRARAQ